MKIVQKLVLAFLFSIAGLAATPTSPVLLDGMKELLTRPAVGEALKEVQITVYAKLSQRGTLTEFLKFATANMPLFAQWPAVCSDFVQEVTTTMPVDQFLNKLGVNKGMLEAAPRGSVVDTPEDEAAKDNVITDILKNSKLHAITSLVTMGVGYVVSFLHAPTTKTAETEAQNKTEALLQNALRKALKKNLNLKQLKALHSFSQTRAFTILIDNLDELKEIFFDRLLKLDPTILEKFFEYADQLQTMAPASVNMPSPVIVEETVYGVAAAAA